LGTSHPWTLDSDIPAGMTNYIAKMRIAVLLWETTPEGRTTRYAHNKNHQLHSVNAFIDFP